MTKLGIWADFEAKIVCNELRRQNLISFQDWVHDASHCAKTFSPTSYLGYCVWAIPCLRLMRKYPPLAARLAVVVRWMVADLKYEKGISTQRHLLGRIVRRGLFWPGNWLLGCLARLARFNTRSPAPA
ncbi:hypothetical protein D3C85_1023350 [compost metagenome]